MSLLIAGALGVWLLSVVWCCVEWFRAPYGWEDEDGYHDGFYPGERLP